MLKKTLFLSVFSKSFASSLVLLAVTSCACTDSGKVSANKKASKDQEIAALDTYYASRKTTVMEAAATVKSFKGDQVKGKVTFKKVPDGIKIVADIDGLTPGKHGFHVHEFGDCSNEGAAAGEHFNPTKKQHGAPDSADRHVGDLGNLIADESGHAHYERVDKIIALEGDNSIVNRSIIIHADPDDFTTQPSGASGKKIACGVIEVVERR